MTPGCISCECWARDLELAKTTRQSTSLAVQEWGTFEIKRMQQGIARHNRAEHPAAIARTDDPQTSHEAAKTVNVKRGQALVLDMLKSLGDATNEELENTAQLLGLDISESGVRTRRVELTRLGLVEDTGQKRETLAGNAAKVWKAVA
jgi:hypothetical protein